MECKYRYPPPDVAFIVHYDSLQAMVWSSCFLSWYRTRLNDSLPRNLTHPTILQKMGGNWFKYATQNESPRHHSKSQIDLLLLLLLLNICSRKTRKCWGKKLTDWLITQQAWLKNGTAGRKCKVRWGINMQTKRPLHFRPQSDTR